MDTTDLESVGNVPDPTFDFQVRDIVNHIKEPDSIIGQIIQIDWNLINLGYGVTTCLVQWNDSTEPSITWTNKLMKAA